MTTIDKLRRDLNRAGYDYKSVTVYNVNGSGKDCNGILVNHDYTGLYPSIDAIRACEVVRRIAAKHGRKSETRGNRNATLIYLN